MQKRNYGLFTAIAMIVGIVIGSGIFFKADDILNYADANVLLGVLIFVIAAVAIIFGSLTISQLATRTDKPGGLITYAEKFVGIGTATVFGWFQTFLYLPTLGAVVAWVSGIYIANLFGIADATVSTYTLIGFIALTVLYFFNILSAKLGGLFQNASMVIKLIPLILFAVLGLVFGDPATTLGESAGTFAKTAGTLAWVGAFGPVAFSFDGWIVSTSICHEIKNSKKNLPIALSIAPIVILLIYVAYFVGISAYLGTDAVLQHGDNAVYVAAENIFNSAMAAKVVLVAVIISVLGTVNGLVLGLIRMPYAMALRKMMPASDKFSKETEKLGGMPVNSALLAYGLSVLYLLVHHFITDKAIFPSGDISEISISMLYILYIILYVAVIKLYKKGEIKSPVTGIVIPVLAMIGSLIIFSGAVTSPMFIVYIAICAVFIGFSYLYYRKNKDIIK